MIIKQVISNFLTDRLLSEGRLVLFGDTIPVRPEVLLSMHPSQNRLSLSANRNTAEQVSCDLIVIDNDHHHATAVIIGGRSNEPRPSVARAIGRHLLAAEVTMVEALRTRGFRVDVGVAAILALGEASWFQEELLVRWSELDDLFDADVARPLARHLWSQSPVGIRVPQTALLPPFTRRKRPRLAGRVASPNEVHFVTSNSERRKFS